MGKNKMQPINPMRYSSRITMRDALCPLLPASTRGQAMVEYLLATIFAALIIGAAFYFFFSALRGYYGLLTFMVGLPIP